MTRLTDNQALLAAGATEWPDFKVGDKVTVLFSVQDPIDGVVVEEPDRNGWIKVRAPSGIGGPEHQGEEVEVATDSTYEFLALAAATVRRGEEAAR